MRKLLIIFLMCWSGTVSAQWLNVPATSQVNTSSGSKRWNFGGSYGIFDPDARYLNINLLNSPNGIAPLDAGGKIPFANLPASIQIFKGTWSASSNSPVLADGVGTTGWIYQASTSGTVNFGHGNIVFSAGDYVGYNGSIWQWSPGTSAVRSVNGYQGIVNLVTDDITEGSINKYYADTRVQTYGDARYARLGASNNITGIQRFNYGGTEVYIGPPDGGNKVISTNGAVNFGSADIGYIQGQDFVNSIFTRYTISPGGIEFIRPLTQAYPTFRLITTNGTDANPQVSLSFGYNLTSNPGYGEDVLQYSARNLYWKGSQVATYSDLTGYYNWPAAAIPQGRVIFAGATNFPTSSANFYWDNTNSRLGIGSSTAPSAPLHVFGNEARLDGTSAFYSIYDNGTATRVGYMQGMTGTNLGLRFAAAAGGRFGFFDSGNGIADFKSNFFQFGQISGTPSGLIQVGRNRSISALNSATGRNIYVISQTLTDSTSAASATITNGYINYIAPTTIAATNTGITYTNLGTLTLAAPVAGTNVSITNPYSLWSLGALRVDGNLIATLPTYSSGTFTNAIYNSTNNQFESMQGTIKNVSSTKTANYSTLATDEIIPVNSTAGTFNITLLSSALAGRVYTIDNTAGTANSVTVVGTIDGATNYTLNSGKSITLYKTATGTNTWNITAIK